MDQKQKILNFLQTQLLGTVATVSTTGSPEAATVAFSETPELEIIFGTFSDTRKFKNIEQNQRVAFVIGAGNTTVQYEGLATITEGTALEAARATHLAKNPGSKKYAFEKFQRFITLTPVWVRYTNFDTKEVFEMTF